MKIKVHLEISFGLTFEKKKGLANPRLFGYLFGAQRVFAGVLMKKNRFTKQIVVELPLSCAKNNHFALLLCRYFS